MVTTRVTWDSLPDGIRRDIEAQTGPLSSVEPVSSGFNSELAVVLHSADEATFVKGLRADHPRVWTQNREKAVNPHVAPVTAALRWSIDNGEWNLLAFEHAPGRHVDYSPGSPDLAKFVIGTGESHRHPFGRRIADRGDHAGRREGVFRKQLGLVQQCVEQC